MFEKTTCERCGKQYRAKTMSENKGRHYCKNCISKCLVCGKKLPIARYFGQTASLTQAFFGNPFTQAKEREEKPWIGSGLCEDCYRKKTDEQEEEQRLIREAELAKARETLKTPEVWVCHYCNTINRGRFCCECGASRKKEKETWKKIS